MKKIREIRNLEIIRLKKKGAFISFNGRMIKFKVILVMTFQLTSLVCDCVKMIVP